MMAMRHTILLGSIILMAGLVYRYLCDGQLTHCVPQPGTDVWDIAQVTVRQRVVT